MVLELGPFIWKDKLPAQHLTVFVNASDSWLVQQLAFPWYRIASRINWNQALFVPFFAAVTLAFAVMGINRLVHARWVIIAASVVAVIVFGAFSGLHAYRANKLLLRDSLSVNATPSSQARVDRNAEAAFRWLHDHGRRDETVVNEPNVDGSLWMYAQEGVKPLLGWAPTSLSSFRERYATRDWKGRVYLVSHIQHPGEDGDTRGDKRSGRRVDGGWKGDDLHQGDVSGRGTVEDSGRWERAGDAAQGDASKRSGAAGWSTWRCSI